MKKIILISLLLFILLILRIFFFEIVSISSSSMFPTLISGDYVLISKLKFDIKRGDIITFKPSDTEPIYIKRVIGLPGDKIMFKGDHLLVNSVELELVEEQLTETLPDELLSRQFYLFSEVMGNIRYQVLIDKDRPTKDFEELTIGENEYFVAGDNRNYSEDSRFFGSIKKDQIIGIASVTLFNINIVFPWEDRNDHTSIEWKNFFKDLSPSQQ